MSADYYIKNKSKLNKRSKIQTCTHTPEKCKEILFIDQTDSITKKRSLTYDCLMELSKKKKKVTFDLVKNVEHQYEKD